MTAHLIAVLLACLAQRETPNGVPTHPGLAGETGRWQLTPAVRHDRGAELTAQGIAITDEAIAQAHVLWLIRRFEVRGVSPSPFQVAEAWNAGFGAVRRHQVPASSVQFAREVSNLVEDAK